MTTTQEPAQDADALVADPLVRTEINIGYARVSTGGQNTTTPGGRLVCHVFAELAECMRELIVIGTKEGPAAARARGRVGGRPSVATEEIIRAARDLLRDPGRSITSIAKPLGVSPGTLSNHISDLRELRAGAVPRRLEAPTR